jgi:hypothetical protein
VDEFEERLMGRRSLATVLALIAALVGVVASLAWSPILFSAHGRSAQVFIFSDDRHPGATTLLLNVAAALPRFQSYQDQRMTCDGVVFSYGEAPWQTIIGYYGAVRARPAGQSYHCVFHDWQDATALDIPAIASPSFPRFVTPEQDASLARGDKIAFTLTSALDYPVIDIQARDQRGHWAYADYGLGGGRSHGEFKPVAGNNFVAGSGVILAQYQIDHYPTVAGWLSVQLMYRPATVLPVTWM